MTVDRPAAAPDPENLRLEYSNLRDEIRTIAARRTTALTLGTTAWAAFAAFAFAASGPARATPLLIMWILLIPLVVLLMLNATCDRDIALAVSYIDEFLGPDVLGGLCYATRARTHIPERPYQPPSGASRRHRLWLAIRRADLRLADHVGVSSSISALCAVLAGVSIAVLVQQVRWTAQSWLAVILTAVFIAAAVLRAVLALPRLEPTEAAARRWKAVAQYEQRRHAEPPGEEDVMSGVSSGTVPG